MCHCLSSPGLFERLFALLARKQNEAAVRIAAAGHLDASRRPGELARFGYPISEEHQELDPESGKLYTVQWFERARFEYHPENAGTPYEVELGLVGKQAFGL